MFISYSIKSLKCVYAKTMFLLQKLVNYCSTTVYENCTLFWYSMGSPVWFETNDFLFWPV